MEWHVAPQYAYQRRAFHQGMTFGRILMLLCRWIDDKLNCSLYNTSQTVHSTSHITHCTWGCG
eukprot:m.206177 g.206177  ORF g.206177 m.206177 type:complete len:63 (+) comp15019_c4_seq4:2461-2649(+)